jgi:pSer/pThr/pTyr-binding forkhead associated (FHA) protein
MIQLNILSGRKAGAQSAARRFPFRIGRALGNDLQLDDDGIWDRHLTLEFNRQKGFTLATAQNSLATINGGLVQTAILRNGDIITLGSAKLQFWLAAARQRGLCLREAFVWALLAAVTATQFALIYWLIR